MGSVIDYEACPKCGGTYVTEYYYRSDETFGFCTRCGYTHNIAFKRTEDWEPIPDEDGVTRLHEEEYGGAGCAKITLKGSSASQLIPLSENDDMDGILEWVKGIKDLDKDKTYVTWRDADGKLYAAIGKMPEDFIEDTGEQTETTDKEPLPVDERLSFFEDENTRIYGVYRNYRGLEEKRYLYTGEELVKLENNEHGSFGIQNKGFCPSDVPDQITIDELDGMDSSFWSNDTYHIVELKTEDEIRAFLTAPSEGICDYEDPPIMALEETWSTLGDECMYTGNTPETMQKILKELGIKKEQTEFRDPRYQILIDAGMPEDDFYLNWPDDDDHYRYGAVYEALKNGTYQDLVKRLN